MTTERKKQKIRIGRKLRRLSNRHQIVKYLLNNSCVDCGEDDILVLEFDHVRGEKFKEVSKMMRYSWERISEEIAKCEIRCCNCHTRRHMIEEDTFKVMVANSFLTLLYKRQI